MPEVAVKDKDNNQVGKMDLPADVFGIKVKKAVIHGAVVNFLANQRQGTHATKTKGLVSGGGKKPWKQKHTGRARSGSNRSPLWRGGGTVFGPQPRDYSYDMPRKARRLALKAALSEKFGADEVTVIEGFAMEKPRTKDMVSILRNLELDGKSTLVVIPEYNEAVLLSGRNIPGVTVRRASDLNSYEVMAHSRLLMTRQAAEILAEVGKK
ncbi:MAG: 50S ribosomal protein L4 [Candidatus Sulfobium sp.]|jgi:large subunit ribosomal protein L4